jgi:creatinine amidohydrolase
MRSWVWFLAAGLFTAWPAAAKAPSILEGTMAELSMTEFEAAVARGSVALWAIGSIEEHGPHLPLATDVYVPAAQLRLVQARLKAAGVESLIVPPQYWAVNRVTGAFPGSIDIRPEVMTGLMEDVFRSLAKAGLREVYCITGHYDAAHNRAILAAVRAANREGRIRAVWVAPAGLAARLGVKAGEDGVLVADMPPPSRPGYADLHAGEGETSMMLHAAPATVDAGIMRRLPPTELTPADVARWREGYETARAITPGGYLGAPAAASAAAGRARLEAEATAYAAAILAGRTPAKP